MPAARSSTRQRDRRSNDPNYAAFVEDTVMRVQKGEFPSFSAAARETGIPRATLTDRARRRHSDWKTACENQQLLTPDQEAVLVSWAIHRGSIGMPFSPADLRAEASDICGKDVGKRWHKKFEARHPELRAAKPAKLDPKRAKNFNEAIINDYFDKLESLHARFPGGVPPEHIWNMDEKGIQMGGGRKKSSKKFYFLKDQKQRYRISSDNLELVTILECISAAGEVVPPSFCLQNGSVPDLRHELQDDEWGSIYFSESGWTDTYNCERWLEEVFIPFAKKKMIDCGKPIVLTMDGHDTHEKPELQRIIYKHLDNENLEIIIFCFPSKCTHKCQPLDVTVFSSVERKWQDVCDHAIKERAPINRFTVIPQYIHGTREALSKDLIRKAFKHTGIYPVKRTVFSKDDFAPSKASSSIVHVPDDFPVDFPSSDGIEIDSDYEPPEELGVSDCSDDEEDTPEVEIDDNASDISILDARSEKSNDDADEGEAIPGNSSQHSTETNDAESGTMGSLFRYLTSIETSMVHMTRSATAKLDLFTAAPPKFVSEQEDRQRSHEDLFKEVRMLRQHTVALNSALQRALGQLSAANAHCTSIHRELESVRLELENATKKKQPRGSKKIKARFLTSAAMREEFEREDAERLERDRVAAEKDQQKQAESAQRAIRVADDALNRVFVGRIASYKKDDLKALALSLSLSDKGTNLELSSRIQDYFDTHPDLKSNTRFSGLFQQTRRRNNAPVVQEDVQREDEEQDSRDEVEQGDPYHDHDQISTAAQPLQLPHPSSSTQPQMHFIDTQYQAYPYNYYNHFYYPAEYTNNLPIQH